jgi:hypothetical protein
MCLELWVAAVAYEISPAFVLQIHVPSLYSPGFCLGGCFICPNTTKPCGVQANHDRCWASLVTTLQVSALMLYSCKAPIGESDRRQNVFARLRLSLMPCTQEKGLAPQIRRASSTSTCCTHNLPRYDIQPGKSPHFPMRSSSVMNL